MLASVVRDQLAWRPWHLGEYTPPLLLLMALMDPGWHCGLIPTWEKGPIDRSLLGHRSSLMDSGTVPGGDTTGCWEVM